MKKQIIAILMTALLAAGSMPVTAADAGAAKTADSNTNQENSTLDEKSGEKKETEKLKDKSNAKTSKESLSSKTKQKEAEVKTDTSPIVISTLEELQKIGMEEGYPLDGNYELQNDIDAKQWAEAVGNNSLATEQTAVQKNTWKPIGTKEEPFTGTLSGNGHLILNMTIAPEEGNASFFESFEGTIKDLAFINLHTVSKTGSAALFAIEMNQADMSNVLLGGKAELQNSDGTAYVKVDKTEAANVAARKADSEIEGEAVNTQGQATPQTEGDETERLSGDIAVKEKDCTYQNVSVIGELHKELPEGVSFIRTNPEYLSMMKGEKETITAPELPFGLQFTAWELGQEEESVHVKAAELELTDLAAAKTEVTGKSAGKGLLKAVYQYADTTFTVDSPVVVGEVINEVDELKPVDDVFYGQLEVVAELVPIDGVFPKWMKEKAPDINNDGEKEAVVELYSWEDFKNIGNTQYNPIYTMDADYVLMNDIISDGLPFTPIGTKEIPFTGSFQGHNFIIDVTLNPEIDVNAEYKGLFGAVK